jgi:putative serine protease PepD
VIGRDPLTDSALIRLDNPPKDLRTANLGDSDGLEPGDWVMAIGNPQGNEMFLEMRKE